MHEARTDNEQFIVRELKWGIFEDSYLLPTAPSFKAFCKVDSDTFATSDGRHVSIWTKSTVLITLNLKAISLHYIRRIHQIVATVKKKTELFFISMRSPYTVTEHPFLFSNKVITISHYFENVSVLVTAGQGLMFTRVVIPTIFKTSSPIPEMLKYEKITEIYQDKLFANVRAPVFVDSKEIIIVYFETEVKIHLLDGTLIQQFSDLTMSPLTCVNFYEPKMWLVCGDQEGYTSIVHFQCKNPFAPGSHPESGKLITSYRPETCHLLYSQVFENNFLVTIGLNRIIAVFSLTSERRIQSILFSITPRNVFFTDPNFFVFAEKEITSFHINIFTSHFTSLTANATFLSRCPSVTNAARLICHTDDSIVSLYSPKTAKLLFGIRAVKYQFDIQNFIYPRNLVHDGISFQKTKTGDTAFFRMGTDKILMVDFDSEMLQKVHQKQDIFTSTTFLKTKFLRNKIGDCPTPKHFVAFFRIETKKYSSCLLGVCKSGFCYIYSIENRAFLDDKIILGYDQIMCAAYSSVHGYVIFSCLGHTTVYDLDGQKIVSDTDHTFYTSLLVVSGRTLACGCANGALEIRRFPTMEIQATSQKYEVYHSDKGFRKNLKKEMTSYELIMDVNFSIVSIDYCSPRNSLLTFSPNGEIFLWTVDAFPICHLSMDLIPTAACFLNGYGSIVICSIKTLFYIDWRNFFSEKIEIEKQEMDDFDIREETFDLEKYAEAKIDQSPELETMIKQKQTAKHKFRRIREDEQSYGSLSTTTSRSPSAMGYSSFRVRKYNETYTLTCFDDLFVEEEEIPKHHFYIPKEIDTSGTPKRRKYGGHVQLMSLPANPHPSQFNSTSSISNQLQTPSSLGGQHRGSISKSGSGQIKVKRMRRECETEEGNMKSSSKLIPVSKGKGNSTTEAKNRSSSTSKGTHSLNKSSKKTSASTVSPPLSAKARANSARRAPNGQKPKIPTIGKTGIFSNSKKMNYSATDDASSSSLSSDKKGRRKIKNRKNNGNKKNLSLKNDLIKQQNEKSSNSNGLSDIGNGKNDPNSDNVKFQYGVFYDQYGNKVFGKIGEDNLVYDQDGKVIGHIGEDGSIIGANGEVMGKIGENGVLLNNDGIPITMINTYSQTSNEDDSFANSLNHDGSQSDNHNNITNNYNNDGNNCKPYDDDNAINQFLNNSSYNDNDNNNEKDINNTKTMPNKTGYNQNNNCNNKLKSKKYGSYRLKNCSPAQINGSIKSPGVGTGVNSFAWQLLSGAKTHKKGDIKSEYGNQNPLMYIQNYGNGNEPSPYIIDDLLDPRMGYLKDPQMKYLKIPEEPKNPQNNTFKRKNRLFQAVEIKEIV